MKESTLTESEQKAFEEIMRTLSKDRPEELGADDETSE